MLTKVIGKAILLLSISANVFAGDFGAGNGGGGICINGRCLTLAEAGIVLEDFADGSRNYNINRDVIHKVREIIYSLPIRLSDKSRIFSKVIDAKSSFKKVKSVDPSKYEKVLKYYKDLYADVPGSEDITLLAISDQENSGPAEGLQKDKHETFLLPNYFKSSILTKALTLIHEASVRGKSSNFLEPALRFDEQIYFYINDDNSFSKGKLLRLSNELQYMKYFDIAMNIYDSLFKNKDVLEFEEACSGSLIDAYRSIADVGALNCHFSISQLALLNNFDDQMIGIAKEVGGMGVSTNYRPYNKDSFPFGDIYKTNVAKVCEERKSTNGFFTKLTLKFSPLVKDDFMAYFVTCRIDDIWIYPIRFGI